MLHTVRAPVCTVAFFVSCYSAHTLDAVAVDIRARLDQQTSTNFCNKEWSLRVTPDKRCKVALPLVLEGRGSDSRLPAVVAWKLVEVNHYFAGSAMTLLDVLPEVPAVLNLPAGAVNKANLVLNLNKGDSAEIRSNETSSRFYVGTGWDVAQGATESDVDLSCLLLSSDGELVDFAFWGQLTACENAVVHNGDNRTGEGEGDDESIEVDLRSLPKSVEAVLFVLNAYQGGNLDAVSNISFRLVRCSDSQELIQLSHVGKCGKYNAIIMCGFVRSTPGSSDWKLHSICAPTQGTVFNDARILKDAHGIVSELSKHNIPSVKRVNPREWLRELPPTMKPTPTPPTTRAATTTTTAPSGTAQAPPLPAVEFTAVQKVILFVLAYVVIRYLFG